MSTVNSV